MRKKLWAAVLVAAVVATLLPVQLLQREATVVQAAPAANAQQGKEVKDTDTDGNGTTDKGFVYTYSLGSKSNTATITGYVGNDKDVSVPTSIETVSAATSTSSASAIVCNVTRINAQAFNGKSGIATVKIAGGMNPDGTQYGVTYIGAKAFAGCPDLTTVELPSTVSNIETEAFADCVSLTNIKVEDGNQYFKVYNDSLYSYSMKSGTGAYNLMQYAVGKKDTKYTVPDEIKTTLVGIDDGAFWGCVSLEEVEIPSTVKSIGNEAFYQCSALKKIEVPESVTSVGTKAFAGCISLTSAAFGNSFKTLNAEMFSGCTSLEEVILPSDLTTIDTRAFYECKALTSFEVPSNVAILGEYSFAYCSNLSHIVIPIKTTRIGSNAFLNTPVVIYCHNGSQAASYAMTNRIQTQWVYTVSFYDDRNLNKLLSAQEVLEGGSAVPPQVTTRAGFQMSWVGTYTGVISDNQVYADWKRLYNITFIDDYNGVTDAQQVVDGGSATIPSWSMDGYVLSWDRVVPDPITADVGEFHAKWTNMATGKEVKQDTPKPADKNTTLTKGGRQYQVTSADPLDPQVRFTGVVNVTGSSLTIPSTVKIRKVTYKVTSIKAKSVAENTTIKSVIIGTKVKKIGSKAFYGCTSLKTVKFKTKGLASIGSNAFGKIHRKAKFYAYNSKMTKYKKYLKKSGIKSPTVERLT